MTEERKTSYRAGNNFTKHYNAHIVLPKTLKHTSSIFFTFLLAGIQHGIAKFTKVTHCGEEATACPLVRIVHIRSILQSAMLISDVVAVIIKMCGLNKVTAYNLIHLVV